MNHSNMILEFQRHAKIFKSQFPHPICDSKLIYSEHKKFKSLLLHQLLLTPCYYFANQVLLIYVFLEQTHVSVVVGSNLPVPELKCIFLSLSFCKIVIYCKKTENKRKRGQERLINKNEQNIRTRIDGVDGKALTT